MTKERELLFKIVETWGNAAITSEERERWLKEYARQQSVDFLNWAKDAVLQGDHYGDADFYEPFNAQAAYSLFIKQQP